MVEAQETRKQSFVARLEENRGGPYPFLRVESQEGPREVPVLSVRNSDHHRLIAEHIVSGSTGVFEVGVIGVLKAIPSDSAINNGGEKVFWEIKRGRKLEDKVPMMMLPEHHDKVIDYDKIHPDFAYLKDSGKRRKFYGTIPFHAILPLADGAIINQNVFVTTPEDSKKKPLDQQVSNSTVCVFFSGGDKAWNNIAQLANTINPNVHLGISSLNDHEEQSPYDFKELIDYVNKKQRIDFNFIVEDPIVAKYQIKSSMTIIRLPQVGEPPEIVIIRKGSIGADTLRRHMGNMRNGGHLVRELASAKFASHGHSEEVRGKGLDDRVLGYLSEVNS
ncbi:MAG: hypothetical protein Q8P29_04500 [Candidatus Levybacteria bacterium]|nr:hypothetical protein [Candidatus Levybacteria bacterium]